MIEILFAVKLKNREKKHQKCNFYTLLKISKK